MKALRINSLFLLLLLFSPTLVLASGDRLTLNAKINGDNIRLAFDTGTPTPLTILSPTARKLSLKTEERKGKRYAFFTIYIEGHEIVNAQALVMDSIPFPDIDGLVGCPPFGEMFGGSNGKICLYPLRLQSRKRYYLGKP
jgi:hypothetical protein